MYRYENTQQGDSMEQVNWLAIIVAALGSFLLGGPWYSKALFGTLWNREAGQSKPAGSGHPARVFGVSFVFSLIAATAFAWLLVRIRSSRARCAWAWWSARASSRPASANQLPIRQSQHAAVADRRRLSRRAVPGVRAGARIVAAMTAEHG